MKNYFVIISLLFLLSGCFKPDAPMREADAEQMVITDSSFGPVQLYIDLAGRKVVSRNSIYDWDLAFENGPNGFHIKLNSAKGVGAYNTGNRNFDVDYKKDYYPFLYDNPDGDPMHTAIGEWGDFSFSNPQSYGFVYVINRGLFEQGRKIGFKKMIVKNFKDSSYHILFANPDGSERHYATIPKTQGTAYTYFTFEEGGKTISAEPANTEWDLLLTPYIERVTHLKYLFKLDNVYAVYDALLLNRQSRAMAADSVRRFEEINFRYLNDYAYNNQSDFIGNRFWYWDDIYNDFAVNEKPVYIIKDKRNNYYKIKITQFNRSLTGRITVILNIKNL